ncbi:MAG: hypothetical protein ABW199_06025 [Caulobacterales bacterium]
MSRQEAEFHKIFEELMLEAAGDGDEAVTAARKAGALAFGRDADRAFEAFSRASDLKPLDAAPRIALARLLAAKGDLDGARMRAQAAFDIAFDEADRGFAAFALGEIAEAGGDLKEARAQFEMARKLAETVCANDPHDAAVAHDLAAARQRLAEFDLRQGEAARAEEGHKAALAILNQLAERQRGAPAILADRAFSLARLADLALNAGNETRAIRHADDAERAYALLADQSTKSDPDLNAARAQLAALRAEIARRNGAFGEARREMERALTLRNKQVAADPSQRGALALTWRRHADMLSESGEVHLAEAARGQARTLAEALYKEQPQDDIAGRNLLDVLLHNGAAELAEGALEPARRTLADAVHLADARLAASPKDSRRMSELAAAWDRLADVAITAKKPQAALDALARALELAHMTADSNPGATGPIRNLAAIALKYGALHSENGNHQSARAILDMAFKLRLQLAEAAGETPNSLLSLAVALERLGLAAQADRDPAAARAAWEDELSLAGRIWKEPTAEGLRFCAIVRTHLASLSGADAKDHRAAALDALDQIESVGKQTPEDARLRASLQR